MCSTIMRFEEKLQKLRKEKGMSQENLAEILNVSRQSISKWESGASYPEMEKLIAISEMFGVTLDGLIKDGPLEKDDQNSTSVPFWQARGSFYEYKSQKTLFGLPLVHVNIGLGMRKAKGIIAVGNIATGLISIGLIAKGLLTLGILSIGILGFGVISVGLLLAIGCFSLGTISIGAIAVGLFALGAVSIGMFSLGALSIASHIAIGDFANGHIAIGETAKGIATIQVEDTNKMFSSVTSDEVRNVITREFPKMWKWVVDLFANMFR